MIKAESHRTLDDIAHYLSHRLLPPYTFLLVLDQVYTRRCKTMPPFEGLPSEIQLRICDFVHLNDLLGLARASRICSNIAQISIYATVCVRPVDQALKFCNTIRSSQHLGSMVRSFTISDGDRARGIQHTYDMHDNAFRDGLKGALINMGNLQHFSCIERLSVIQPSVCLTLGIHNCFSLRSLALRIPWRYLHDEPKPNLQLKLNFMDLRHLELHGDLTYEGANSTLPYFGALLASLSSQLHTLSLCIKPISKIELLLQPQMPQFSGLESLTVPVLALSVRALFAIRSVRVLSLFDDEGLRISSGPSVLPPLLPPDAFPHLHRLYCPAHLLPLVIPSNNTSRDNITVLSLDYAFYDTQPDLFVFKNARTWNDVVSALEHVSTTGMCIAEFSFYVATLHLDKLVTIAQYLGNSQTLTICARDFCLDYTNAGAQLASLLNLAPKLHTLLISDGPGYFRHDRGILWPHSGELWQQLKLLNSITSGESTLRRVAFSIAVQWSRIEGQWILENNHMLGSIPSSLPGGYVSFDENTLKPVYVPTLPLATSSLSPIHNIATSADAPFSDEPIEFPSVNPWQNPLPDDDTLPWGNLDGASKDERCC